MISVQEPQGNLIFPINFIKPSYGIAPKFYDGDGKSRIEVFNPCDESDDQKTPTSILFDNDGNFVEFGSLALQEYAEILDDEGTAMLFQSVKIYILPFSHSYQYKMHLLHMHTDAVSTDGRKMPLMKVISTTLKYIAERAIEKLTEQVQNLTFSFLLILSRLVK